MKTLFSAASAALICASLATTPAVAQQAAPGANASKFGIAVVNMNKIFLEHAAFKAQMDQLKAQMKGVEDKLKVDRENIANAEKQLQQYNAGSQEYKDLDERIAQAKAAFNLKMSRERKLLMEQESKLYYQTYNQVNGVIQQVATQQQIGLVLRFNADKVDPNNPQELIKAINNPIVFQNNIDLTDVILARLNGGAAVNLGARPTTGPRTQ